MSFQNLKCIRVSCVLLFLYVYACAGQVAVPPDKKKESVASSEAQVGKERTSEKAKEPTFKEPPIEPQTEPQTRGETHSSTDAGTKGDTPDRKEATPERSEPTTERKVGPPEIRPPKVKTKILFDAGHAVDAGNADWIIDDNSPRPLPAHPSSETAWKGAISRWAYELYKLGTYEIYSTTKRTLIRYGTSDPLDLKNFDIFATSEPNTRFTTAEKKALIEYIRDGGKVIFVFNHRRSDRNRDNWDSPKILHDFLVNNGVQSNPFGFVIPGGLGTKISGRYRTTNANHAILKGPFRTIKSIAFHGGSSFQIDPSVNPSVTALIWSSSTRGNTHVVAGISRYKKGWLALVGDSSVVDDGTGDPRDNLYRGWDELDNGMFMLNLTDYLVKQK